MTKQEIETAIENKEKLVWNDPDPIEDNDYTIQKIWGINDETAMIQYGSNNQKYLSEAEVYLSEIKLKQK